MNDYEAKQEACRERYEERAEAAERASVASIDRARSMASVIPFGQPILVGHHSERRDRSYRAKIRRGYDRGFEESKKAEYYRDKAAGVGKGGISSDDPDAVDKLREKLAKREKKQATYKAANSIIRSKPKNEVTDAKVAKLVELGLLTEDTARKVFEPDFAGQVGIPSYELTNNNANIKRIKDRIASLEREAAQQAETGGEPVVKVYGDGAVEYREEDNRVRLVFPGKPPQETRAMLKRHGFRWSPSASAWQRHLNNTGRASARYVLELLGYRE